MPSHPWKDIKMKDPQAQLEHETRYKIKDELTELKSYGVDISCRCPKPCMPHSDHYRGEELRLRRKDHKIKLNKDKPMRNLKNFPDLFFRARTFAVVEELSRELKGTIKATLSQVETLEEEVVKLSKVLNRLRG